MFCFDLLVFGLKRNVLLCLSQFPDQIKLLCFIPEFVGQNENDLLAIQCFMYQIKMFCFRSDSKQTKSKRFAFVPITSFDIETFVISFRYRWHYYVRLPLNDASDPLHFISFEKDNIPPFSLPSSLEEIIRREGSECRQTSRFCSICLKETVSRDE